MCVLDKMTMRHPGPRPKTLFKILFFVCVEHLWDLVGLTQRLMFQCLMSRPVITFWRSISRMCMFQMVWYLFFVQMLWSSYNQKIMVVGFGSNRMYSNSRSFYYLGDLNQLFLYIQLLLMTETGNFTLQIPVSIYYIG